jgi:hypothetical protein
MKKEHLFEHNTLPFFFLKQLMRQYWLLKSEPETRLVDGVDIKYSIDDMERDVETGWDGIVGSVCILLMSTWVA